MTWQTGTATDYLDLLDQVKEVATSNHIHTPVINAAGTGYTVDDILTVIGGTSTHVATLRVLTITGGGGTGPIGTMREETGGAYTVDPPDLATNAVTGGTGSSATVTLTATSTGWTKNQATQEALSAVVADGGTGYTVSDQITIVGGLGVGVAAVFNVDTAPAGIVGTVSLVTAGDYEAMPSNPASVTGGTGNDDCTLTITAQDSTGTAERTLILEGNGGASETILVGMKTFQTPDVTTFDTCYNWSCHAFTGFNSSLLFHFQAGISPGLDGSGDPSATTGSFMPLKESTAFTIEFWMNFTNRRLILVAKVEDAVVTHYVSMYLGYQNQFGTSVEFPYPICVSASSSRHNTLYTDTEPRISGIGEVVGINGRSGPMWYRRSDSVWQQIKNSSAVDSGSPSRSAQINYTLYPGALPNNALVAAADDIVASGSGLDWQEIIPNTGIPGTATKKLQDTPMTGGDLKLLVPFTIVASDDTFFEIVGELDDCFWFSGVGSVTSEDTITDGSEIYRVFQNGNRAEEFSLFALKETF